MTTTINASNSGGGGLVQTADASGILALQTAGTTAVTVNASQNVGVGTASPTQKVSIAGGLSFNSALSFSGSGYEIGQDGANFLCFSAGSAGTRFINASTATEFMRLDTSSNLQFNSGYGSVAVAYGCRAWVNFNGTGTVAIRASGNVSSITDNGTGNYTVNFTTAMPDASYSICGTVGRGVGFSAPRIIGVGNTNPTANAAQVSTIDDGGGNQDCEFTMVAIIR